MRKIFMIFTLIVSSFFVFKTNVSADTIETTVYSSYYSHINERFIEAREKIIDFANEKNKYYLIFGDHYASYIRFYLFDNPNLQFNQYKLLYYGTYTDYGIDSSNVITEAQTRENFEFQFWNTAILFFYNFYDTNVKNIEYTGSDTFIIKHNDLSYTVEPGGSFPTLYQIYLDDNKPPEEPPVEDDDIIIDENLNSFYSLVMEKIQLFANYFISNNILLFVIGIFILIFIIELIRRYLL